MFAMLAQRLVIKGLKVYVTYLCRFSKLAFSYIVTRSEVCNYAKPSFFKGFTNKDHIYLANSLSLKCGHNKADVEELYTTWSKTKISNELYVIKGMELYWNTKEGNLNVSVLII